MGKTRKIVNIILCILFIAFAILQLNDPDGWLWFLIYFVVALISIIENFKKLPKTFLWVVFFGLVIYSAFYFSSLIDFLKTDNKEEIFGEMVYEKPYLEGTREFIGLILAALAILHHLKRKPTS